MIAKINKMIVAVMLIGLLCGGRATQAELANSQIYQLYKRSVLKITVTCKLFDGTMETRSGTGFLVSTEGHVITSYHLIGDPEDCESLDINGSIRNARDPWTYDTTLTLAPVDSAFDVSLLTVDTPISSTPILLRRDREPGVVEDFLFLTYGLSENLAATPSTVRTLQLPAIWQTNHAFNPGDSGAPILDKDGLAIGLVLGRVGSADMGAGPVNVQAVGWMVSTIPAILDITSGLSPPLEFNNADVGYLKLPLPTLAIETFPISLKSKTAKFKSKIKNANGLDQLISAPDKSVISDHIFSGITNEGSVALMVDKSGQVGRIQARVTKSNEAVVDGELKVFYDPVTIQMAYPIGIVKDNHPNMFTSSTKNVDETIAAEKGYRIIEASFQPKSLINATEPKIEISASGTSLNLSTVITSGPAVSRYSGEVYGIVLTTQERIPELVSP